MGWPSIIPIKLHWWHPGELFLGKSNSLLCVSVLQLWVKPNVIDYKESRAEKVNDLWLKKFGVQFQGTSHSWNTEIDHFKGEEINSVRANYTLPYHMVCSVMVKRNLIWFNDYGLTLEKHCQVRTDKMKTMDP